MELAGLNIKFLPGVGEKKAAVLYEELQVQSYEDMLYHVPFKSRRVSIGFQNPVWR